MTIRKRTDGVVEGSGLRRGLRRGLPRVAGGVAAGGLGIAAALHGAWASGSTWPTQSPDELADLVVGRRPFPGPALCWGVAGLLAAAAAVTAARADLIPSPARARRPLQKAANIVAAAMLIRGTAGMITSGAGIGRTTPIYKRWDLRLYSPLCLVLGLLAAGSQSPHTRCTR